MMVNSFGLGKLAHVLLNIPALSQVIKKQASLKESLIKSFDLDLIECKKSIRSDRDKQLQIP